MNNEIWKDIKGYEGLYQVSNLGNVKSIPRIIDSQFKGKPIKREVYEKVLKKVLLGLDMNMFVYLKMVKQRNIKYIDL